MKKIVSLHDIECIFEINNCPVCGLALTSISYNSQAFCKSTNTATRQSHYIVTAFSSPQEIVQNIEIYPYIIDSSDLNMLTRVYKYSTNSSNKVHLKFMIAIPLVKITYPNQILNKIKNLEPFL